MIDLYKSVVLLLAALVVLVAFAGNLTAQDLALDTSFNAGVSDTPANNFVSAVQPDGKILVGGNYQRVNGAEHIGLVRLNADGTTDPSFNVGGSGPNADVSEIVILGDGKVLIGGEFTTYNGTLARRLTRLNPDGTLDPTFNVGGSGVGAGGSFARVTTIVVQSDGKIVVGGRSIFDYNEILSRDVFRINPDGSFDTTFISGFSSYAGVEQVAIQSDGKIVIAADNSAFYGETQVNKLIRVNPNGTLDLNFPVITGGLYQRIYALAIQPDGKIIIGGSFGTYNGVSRNSLARVNVDGTLDTSFVPPAFATINYVETISVRPDDKILVAGGFDYTDSLRRPLLKLNSDGSLDNTFSLSKTDGPAYHFAQQTDGKIVVTGSFSQLTTGGNHVGIVRMNGDGTIDNSFTASFTNNFAEVMTTAQQSDGKVLVGGTFLAANGSIVHDVARLNIDGTLDSSFSVGLGALYDDLPLYKGVRSIAVQADGKILVGGAFTGFNGSAQTNGLVRLNADGSVDTSFNFPTTNISRQYVEDILIMPSGKILICGSLSASTSPSGPKLVVKLNDDGSIDSTFNYNGPGPIFNGPVSNRVMIQPDGKIVVGGYFRSLSPPFANIILVRFNADGTSDTSFTPVPGFQSSPIRDLALQSDGKIVFGAGPVGSATIGRVNTNGTLDTGFNSPAVGNVNSVLLQSDGKVLAGGSFVGINEVGRVDLARLNTDGTLDPSLTSGFNDAVGYVNSLAFQPDGKLLVGGNFTNYYGAPRSNLLRLTAASPTQTPTATPTSTPTVVPSPTAICTPDGLYDNGPFITDGASTFAISELQHHLGLNTFGFSAAATTSDRIADDFTVPVGGWTIDTITFYAYQPGSPRTSTFNLARFQIWNGPPNMPGSSVVFGDLTTNRLASTSFTNVYRWLDKGVNTTDRPVMSVVANAGTTLPAGTYWIDFQLGGTRSAGPYVPPVTIAGQVNKPDSNAMQFTNAWAPLVDNGPAAAVQDVPFRFNETCAAASPTATSTPTNTPTPTGTPTNTRTSTPTSTPTNTPTSTPTTTPTNTPTPLNAISGTITYGNAIGAPTPRFVSNVTVTGNGPSHIFSTTIFPNGNYALTGFAPGAYTVTPSKTGGVNGITSFDAAKIAQHAVGVASLTGNQLVVADVSGNGSISSFDAGQVAKYVAAVAGFGSTGNWIFSPVNRTYPSVTTSITGEDYTGLLMGEVSGNWTNTGARPVNVHGPEKDISVELPRIVTSGDKQIIVPVHVSEVADKGVISYEFDLRYDPAVMLPLAEPVDVAGTVSRGLSYVTNTDVPGLLRVVMYGPMPISENGVLLNLRFVPVRAPGSMSPLTLERIVFNEDDRTVKTTEGKVELSFGKKY